MLIQLAIRDIVLIDRLDLQLSGGLTVLTGETGAGKSILLDAFALALGARGDGALVRAGEKQGQVTAVFDLADDHPARAAALAHDIVIDGDMLLRRVQMVDGRTRAFINDQPLSLLTLRAIAAEIVEIHGQHDERALVDPTHHRALIDIFGGLSVLAQSVRADHKTWREAGRLHVQESARVQAARKEADFLRSAHAELTKLSPLPGEEAQLAEARTKMMQSEKVVADLREALEAVAGDGSPMSTLSSAMRRLERRAPQAPHLLEPGVKALDDVLQALDHARESFEQALRAAEFDPQVLEKTEERLFALRGAARKYNMPADKLADLAEKFNDDLAKLDSDEAKLGALEAECVRLEKAYFISAKQLSTGRHAAAKTLDERVNHELPPLKLERAEFTSHIESDVTVASPDGIDHVEFWVSTNPGTKPGPLMKIASGGELARFMLALKVALADRGSAPTLVFDEIDSGVGGAVADAIGQRLARLAEKVQVLAVTHAPQVAARALQHMHIAKGETHGGARVATRVQPLVDDARAEEIARMLSGAKITDEARAAARRLLEGAD